MSMNMRDMEQLFKKMGGVAKYRAPNSGAKALVLLSGGMDSAVTLYFAKTLGWDVAHALTFNYGQSHTKETEAAAEIAELADVPLTVLNIASITSVLTRGESALTDHSIDIPETAEAPTQIPPTYVPLRNPLLLTLAGQFAFREDIKGIFIGANAVDYSGYPDCRPEFMHAFDVMINLAVADTGKSFYVVAPIIDITKGEIVKLGQSLNVPWDLTWSCYRGGEEPCGECASCELRAKGFAEAGVKDTALPIKDDPLNIVSTEKAPQTTPTLSSADADPNKEDVDID